MGKSKLSEEELTAALARYMAGESGRSVSLSLGRCESYLSQIAYLRGLRVPEGRKGQRRARRSAPPVTPPAPRIAPVELAQLMAGDGRRARAIRRAEPSAEPHS